MAKKDFSEGIDSILGTETYEERIARMREQEDASESIQQKVTIIAKPKTKKLEQKANVTENSETIEDQGHNITTSFVFNNIHVKKIKGIAYTEGVPIKKVMYEALAEYIAKYETKNGVIFMPKK